MSVTDIKEIKDPMLKRNAAYFDNYARNIYRVLMSRGRKVAMYIAVMKI